jgi:Protein of unknown function (DUF3159)
MSGRSTPIEPLPLTGIIREGPTMNDVNKSTVANGRTSDHGSAEQPPAGSWETEKPKGSPLFAMLLWDIVPSVAAYYGLRSLGYSEYLSLLAGTFVAGLRMLYVATRARRFDGAAAFMVTVFGIGLVLSFLTGDARFLFAIKSVTTAVAGAIFLGSCLVGRPLIFSMAQRLEGTTPEKRAKLDRQWAQEPEFRRVITVMSLVWGFGLLTEAIIRIPLICLLPLDVMAGLSSALLLATFVLLGTWTTWYGKRAQRRGEQAHAQGALEA